MMNDIKRTLNLDMDGVICNWLEGFKKYSGGIPFDDYKSKFGKVKTDLIINDAGKQFWSDLEWMSDGRSLVRFIYNNFLKIKILTATGNGSPSYIKNTEDGKREWLNKNIPSVSKTDIYIIRHGVNKKKYARPGDILVDDMPENIEGWNSVGGIGILHKNTEETTKILSKYII
jgi:5'(3')-deoxyribonucleotidase